MVADVDLEKPLARLQRAEDLVSRHLEIMSAVAEPHDRRADQDTLQTLLQNVVVARQTYDTLVLIVEQASKRQASAILRESITGKNPRRSG